jgi:hypothetical protein
MVAEDYWVAGRLSVNILMLSGIGGIGPGISRGRKIFFILPER